jgi:DNA sulfur modification protein DndB
VNKTIIPAFKAHVGDWEYFLCLMSYAEVDRSIRFAWELGGNKDLATMIQRGISERTGEIREYLLNNKHHFLGSLVVAAVGGNPEYTPVEMVDAQGILNDVDRDFGVLQFDGTHMFFALDGQHRLRAIKDAIVKDPSLAGEDIGVIVVPHFDNAQGQQRTRRLFTNINRYAKPTNLQENIALDEDDGYAILTRRVVNEHPFLSKPDVVRVFTKVGETGELKLAGRSVSLGSTSWTTIGVLYDILRELGFKLNPTMGERTNRATDQVLEDSYKTLVKRLEQLMKACGDVKAAMAAGPTIRDVRSPKGGEASGHPFMRPVVQVTVARAVRHIVDQNQLSWDESLKRLSELDWRLGSPPWSAVFVEESNKPGAGKMAPGKQFTELLYNLLLIHLAPRTKSEIHRAINEYKTIKGKRYPVPEADLAARIPEATPTQP